MVISAVIEGGTVVNVIVGEIDGSVPCPAGVEPGWTFEDGTFSPPPEPEPEPPTLADYEAAIQQHIDATAGERGYRDGFALAGYVASTVAQWVAEAEAFVAWRDAVWLYAHAEMAKVTADPPEREAPTVEGFIGELPAIVWPE